MADNPAVTKYNQLACSVCLREPPIGLTDICKACLTKKNLPSRASQVENLGVVEMDLSEVELRVVRATEPAWLTAAKARRLNPAPGIA